MRILMIGDGAWAGNVFRPMLAAGHEIAAVVVRKRPSDSCLEDAPRGLDLRVLQPEDLNSHEFVEEIKRMDVDLGLSIACDQIMRRPLLNSIRRGFVNFHAGKLPRYRGRNIINWAIINGESEIGLTAHFVDEGIDTGDVILQKTLPIEWTNTYGDVLNRVVESFPTFVVEAVAALDQEAFQPQPQLSSSGTYFCGRTEGDEWLDWSATSFDLHNKIRGISRPAPGARTLLVDRTVIVWKAAYEPSWPKYIATDGQVVGRNADGVLVKTGDSTILLTEVQVEDRPCEKPTWPIGTRLGVDIYRLVATLQSRIQELEEKFSLGVRSI